MPAHEPPMLEDDASASAPDAPSEPPTSAAPHFAPRTPEELAGAAIVRELRELEKQSPPVDRAQLSADWQWFFSEFSKGAAGALGPYAGQFVAVLRARVVANGDDPLQLRLDTRKGATVPVHPEQFVVFYVDPWEIS